MIRPLARRKADTGDDFVRHAFDTAHAEKQRPPGGRVPSVGLSMCGVDVTRVIVGDDCDFDPEHERACYECAVACGTVAAARPGWRGGEIEA